MIDRRRFAMMLAAATAAAAVTPARSAEIGDDGLHVQPWFMQTFLDMAEDKAEA